MRTQTYLGDGLYATFDGVHIALYANGPSRASGATDAVLLEHQVMQALKNWIVAGYPDYHMGEGFSK